MKKIDAHSHIGSFGGWAGVAFTAEKLLEQMDLSTPQQHEGCALFECV